MNRKGSSWHALRARNAHLLLLGFDLLHHAEFSLVRKPQIKLIHFCIEDGNSPLFNDQLLIKRADNVLRKVTKYPADWTHSFIVGMISIYSKENTHTFSLHYPVLLLCPFALYCVQNKDNYWPIHQWSIDDRTIGKVSIKYRWTKSFTGRDTSGTTIDHVSNKCRPTIRPPSDHHVTSTLSKL